MPELRDIIKTRRDHLQISQEFLAWLARCSRNTISNLERGQGEPEQKTLEAVAGALGLDCRALQGDVDQDPWRAYEDAKDAWRPDPVPVEVIPGHTTGAILSIIADLRGPEGTEQRRRARQAADALIGFITAATNADHYHESRRGSPACQMEIRKLRNTILSEVKTDTPEGRAIVELFEDMGWSPDDEIPDVWDRVRDQQRAAMTRDIGARQSEGDPKKMSPGLEALRREVAALRELIEPLTRDRQVLMDARDRIPHEILAELATSQVVDWNTIKTGASDKVQHIILTVKPEDVDFVSAREVVRGVNIAERALIFAQLIALGVPSENEWTRENILQAVEETLDALKLTKKPTPKASPKKETSVPPTFGGGGFSDEPPF